MKASYIGKGWDALTLRNFRFYWLMAGLYKKLSWDEYLSKGGYKIYG